MIIAGMIPFSIIAASTGQQQYLLTDTEKQLLAPQWNAVINKYLPEMISEYGPEFALVGTIALLLVQKSGYLELNEKVS